MQQQKEREQVQARVHVERAEEEREEEEEEQREDGGVDVSIKLEEVQAERGGAFEYSSSSSSPSSSSSSGLQRMDDVERWSPPAPHDDDDEPSDEEEQGQCLLPSAAASAQHSPVRFGEGNEKDEQHLDIKQLADPHELEYVSRWARSTLLHEREPICFSPKLASQRCPGAAGGCVQSSCTLADAQKMNSDMARRASTDRRRHLRRRAGERLRGQQAKPEGQPHAQHLPPVSRSARSRSAVASELQLTCTRLLLHGDDEATTQPPCPQRRFRLSLSWSLACISRLQQKQQRRCSSIDSHCALSPGALASCPASAACGSQRPTSTA